MKICEMKRDAYEFKRDVVVGAENSRTGAIAAEKVLKYFDDKARAVDASIEKLRLKNSTLKAQIHKVESQVCLHFMLSSCMLALTLVCLCCW